MAISFLVGCWPLHYSCSLLPGPENVPRLVRWCVLRWRATQCMDGLGQINFKKHNNRRRWATTTLCIGSGRKECDQNNIHLCLDCPLLVLITHSHCIHQLHYISNPPDAVPHFLTPHRSKVTLAKPRRKPMVFDIDTWGVINLQACLHSGNPTQLWKVAIPTTWVGYITF